VFGDDPDLRARSGAVAAEDPLLTFGIAFERDRVFVRFSVVSIEIAPGAGRVKCEEVGCVLTSCFERSDRRA
jgi:hypothetical protein